MAAELESNADFQYLVHQASGMVAAQLDVTVGRGLIRLRTHAFGSDRSLNEGAQQLTHALNSRVVLEQAKGMVAERLDLDMEGSFLTLRNHARNHNLRLSDLAQSVIDGSLAPSGLDAPPAPET